MLLFLAAAFTRHRRCKVCKFKFSASVWHRRSTSYKVQLCRLAGAIGYLAQLKAPIYFVRSCRVLIEYLVAVLNPCSCVAGMDLHECDMYVVCTSIHPR